MTTAYIRNVAADFESRCEWALAAIAWQRAIDLYPRLAGQLAKDDIANLVERRDVCEASA